MSAVPCSIYSSVGSYAFSWGGGLRGGDVGLGGEAVRVWRGDVHLRE